MNIEEKVERLEREIDTNLTALKKDIEFIKISIEDIKADIYNNGKNGLMKRIEELEKNQIEIKTRFSILIFFSVMIANFTGSYLFKIIFK
jgi:hypothetical protein